MRRVGVLMAVLAISMILIINPSPYIDSCTRGNEHQEAPFLTAADGAESSESITSFSETLADDILYYPDTLHNETELIVSSGASGDKATGGVGSISNTYTVNGQVWGNSTTEGVGWVRLNFTAPTGYTVDGWSWGLYAWGQVGDEFSNYSVYNWETDTWDYQGDLNLYGSEDWTNGTTYNSAHWQDNECAIILESEDLDSAQVGMVYVDCGVVEFYYMTLADSDHYAESFADVSEVNATLGITPTSDGDLGTFHHPGDNAWDYYFWNAPSALAVQVIEWRCHANISSSSYEFALYSADDGGGAQLWTSGSITAPTSAETKKYSPMVTGVESIRLATRHASSPASFIFDYLRGSLSTESGFCHDGSTTAGTSNDADAGTTYTSSTDGDKLTLNMTWASDAQWSGHRILFDTTVTAADIERDYYPFYEIQFTCTTAGTMSLSQSGIFVYYDGYETPYASFAIDGSDVTIRGNMKAEDTTDNKAYIEFYGYFNGAGDSVEFTIDWAKIYSIANFTYGGGTLATSDFMYVDSGRLMVVEDGSGWQQLNHDPALSVDTSVYPVWNQTVASGDENEAGFRAYVGAWLPSGSTSWWETRGNYGTTGTLTDFILAFVDDVSYGAIKFIEDGTAPIIVRSSANPPEPDDDEGVVLKAVVDDGVEVYSVKFNAIVYPTGFSDVDYDATEQSDNLWMHSFSSLDAGNYTFKVIASDGANENDLTEYAYIDFVVREAVIVVEEITLIGAGSDFTMMTFSARINRDCSFTIYEESASSAEADTHTGSVTAPSFNLAWTKLDVDDANVNFTIRFTSGSLTYNYTSQYQVAQTTFYVSTVTQMVSLDTVTVTGRITKLGAYQVYDDLDVLQSYGTLADLDFKIQFTRWGGYDEQNHDFAIKFTNGSQTCWYNSSFYAFKKPVVAAFQTTDPNALYAFQVSFWTLIAVVAIGGMVAVDFYRKEVK